MYKISADDQPTLDIELKDIDWDLIQLNDRHFHIIQNNVSYTAVILDADYKNKTFRIRVNEHTFELELKDRFDQLADKLGMGSSSKNKANDIKAPMPGLVLSILVEEGQEIQKGEPVLILEAMKMENVIKATAPATIKSIKVNQGAAVEKNQVLVELSTEA